MKPVVPAICVILLAGAALSASAGAAVAPNPLLETAITSGPADGAGIEDDQAVFGFAATLDGEPFDEASFRCSVDSAPAIPCATPFETAELDEGDHAFSVFAEYPARLLADTSPAARRFAVIEAGEDEEGCEPIDDEDESAEAEECEEEEAEDGRLPPEECLLRSARARVFAYPEQSKVRLVIRYTSFEPTEVLVDYRLAGARGPLRLGAAHQHLGSRGLVRIAQRLSDAEMERVRAAKRFTVVFGVPGAPRYCRSFETRHLTLRRTVHSQPVWFQSGSVFGGV